MGLYILSGGKLTHLQRLRINVVTEDEMRSNLVKSTLQILRNAPFLLITYLRHYDAALDLEDMEIIHTYAPNLETLYMDWTTMDAIDDDDYVVSEDCTRLINHNGLNFVKT